MVDVTASGLLLLLLRGRGGLPGCPGGKGGEGVACQSQLVGLERTDTILYARGGGEGADDKQLATTTTNCQGFGAGGVLAFVVGEGCWYMLWERGAGICCG